MNFIFSKKRAILLSLSLSFSSALIADENATWLDNINFSGYAKVAISAPNQKNTTVAIDDLSLFVSGKFNRWLNPFLEAEIYDVSLWEAGNGLQFDTAHLAIERFYNDMEVSEADTLRFGKFLASINHWNIVHAAPLVWTSTRPITSKYAQANYITGLQWRHEFDSISGNALEVYVQPAAEFNHKPKSSQERQYETVAGARWIINEDLDYYLGVAFQHAQVAHSDETRNSISIDGNWQHQWFELESELLFTHVDTREYRSHGNDWGGYVQMVVPLVEHFNLITRYEHFEFSNYEQVTNSELGGIVYRPVPSVSFKVEWQQTQGNTQFNQTGLYSSIAVLF